MKYYDNRTIFCTKCQKLRYMGYTNKQDSELCTCSNQDNIPTVIKYKAFKKRESFISKFIQWIKSSK
jgi:hypothetical protein